MCNGGGCALCSEIVGLYLSSTGILDGRWINLLRFMILCLRLNSVILHGIPILQGGGIKMAGGAKLESLLGYKFRQGSVYLLRVHFLKSLYLKGK